MSITELRYHNVENPINRAFERMSQYQWSRELTVNAIEAGATEILFGVDTSPAHADVLLLTMAPGCRALICATT